MGTNNKIRTALEQVKEIARTIYSTSEKGSSHEDLAEKIVELANAALAEPVRNYEVGTAEEQSKRMDAYCASHGERIGCSWRCDECPLCSIDRCDLVWAQMPYVEKEGGAK